MGAVLSSISDGPCSGDEDADVYDTLFREFLRELRADVPCQSHDKRDRCCTARAQSGLGALLYGPPLFAKTYRLCDTQAYSPTAQWNKP